MEFVDRITGIVLGSLSVAILLLTVGLVIVMIRATVGC